MASMKTISQAVEGIKNYLRMNPGTDMEPMIDEVIKPMKVTGEYNVIFPLQAMIASGLVKADVQGKRLRNLRYVGDSQRKAPDGHDDGVPMVPKAQLEEALRRFQSNMEMERKNHLEKMTSMVTELDKVKKMAEEAQGKERIVKVVVERTKKAPQEFTETFHTAFEDILTLAKARENIFLYGPTGSGKTFIGAQLAKVLDLPFYFISGTRGMSESKLAGKVLPTGKNGQWEYLPSEFVKAYENGGVYLFDEIDAVDDNILLLVNTALANDQFAVPERKDKPYIVRHPDFICIAAANTVGTGSDRQYSGRSKLDTATLDRFGIGKVYIGYDDSVEKMLCPDDALRAHLLKYRRAIDDNRLERALSSRFLEKAYKLHQAGWSFGRIDQALFLGWREDEINKVKNYRG